MKGSRREILEVSVPAKSVGSTVGDRSSREGWNCHQEGQELRRDGWNLSHMPKEVTNRKILSSCQALQRLKLMRNRRMNSCCGESQPVVQLGLIFWWFWETVKWSNHTARQETWVESLVWEDPTCYRATTDDHLTRDRAPQQKPSQWEAHTPLESSPHSQQLEKSPRSSEDPAQPTHKKEWVEGKSHPSVLCRPHSSHPTKDQRR